MPTLDEAQDWIGADLLGEGEEKLGTIDQIYVDRETGELSFASVKTGLFGMKSSLVPITYAVRHGDHVHVPVTKEQVKNAPNVGDDEDLSDAEEQRLYQHYNLDYVGGYDGPDHESLGRAASDADTDDAITRSEEELRVGKRTTESGRARLRKYVVTEQVTTTVPVSHEEARIEREPITDANRDAASRGVDISEAEHEITLHAEEPVVEKDVVAKERVRLATETVTDDAEINETVRKEQIEAEGDIRSR